MNAFIGALAAAGVEGAEITRKGDLLVATFPTTGCHSPRALCELTERLAVAMHGAGIAFRRIRTTGLGGLVEVQA